MKRLVILSLFLSSAFCTFAQTQINLNIKHQAAGEVFSYENPITNNLSDPIDASIIRYYISGISLIHDGGTETSIDELYVLADAGEETFIELGVYDNIQSLEQIKFHIGLPYQVNHADITAYPEDHPLSFQSPSMHWGWALGYKFLVAEGDNGPNFGNSFQIHATGDVNYSTLLFDAAFNIEGESSTINILAEVPNIFKDINMGQGVFNHGENAEAADAIANLASTVFSIGEMVVNNVDVLQANQFVVAPNPTHTGSVDIQVDMPISSTYDVQIINQLGQTEQAFSFSGTQFSKSIQGLNSGMYFIQMNNAQGATITQKLIVQ